MSKFRTGRHNFRTIYWQVGSQPARGEDPTVGQMDTAALGVAVVAALNGAPDVPAAFEAGRMQGRREAAQIALELAATWQREFDADPALVESAAEAEAFWTAARAIDVESWRVAHDLERRAKS